MAQVLQVNIAENDLLYCTTDVGGELVEHQVGNADWELKPEVFSDHDLFDCRLALMNALRKIEDEMENRRLIGRIT